MSSMEARLPSFSGPSTSSPETTASFWDRAFLEHPRDLGESYWQHQQRALGFGRAMIAGGIACVIHALVPTWFEHTASGTIVRLYERMRATQRLSR
jgi:hypothetical protein